MYPKLVATVWVHTLLYRRSVSCSTAHWQEFLVSNRPVHVQCHTAFSTRVQILFKTVPTPPTPLRSSSILRLCLPLFFLYHVHDTFRIRSGSQYVLPGRSSFPSESNRREIETVLTQHSRSNTPLKPSNSVLPPLVFKHPKVSYSPSKTASLVRSWTRHRWKKFAKLTTTWARRCPDW